MVFVDRKAEPLHARETFRVESGAEPADRQGLVEPEPEHHAFARPRLLVQRLELAVVAPLPYLIRAHEIDQDVLMHQHRRRLTRDRGAAHRQ